MSEAIEGKFPHTFGLSNNFRNKLQKLLTESEINMEEYKNEYSILFGRSVPLQSDHDCLELVRLLVDIDAEGIGIIKDAPLYLAVRWDALYKDVLLLIRHGADVNAKNKYRLRPPAC